MKPFLLLLPKPRFVLVKSMLVAVVIVTSVLLWVRFYPDQGEAAYQVLAQSIAPQRVGFDPLSSKEVNLAKQLALSDAISASRSDQPMELLLVERHEESKEVYAGGAWPRRADVFFYDYQA